MKPGPVCKRLDHPRIQKLAERLSAQAPELLTFLEGLAAPRAAWQVQLAQHCPESELSIPDLLLALNPIARIISDISYSLRKQYLSRLPDKIARRK